MRPLLALGALLAVLALALPRLAGDAGRGAVAAPRCGREDDSVREPVTLVAGGEPVSGGAAAPGGDAAVFQRLPARASMPPGEPVPAARARLRLFAFDRATGAVLATGAQVWQLDLPEDERFTAGDALRATVRVPPEGVVVEDLPEGRYRVCLLGRRVEGEDPPELEVRAPGTAVALPVDAPRLVRFTLDLRDLEGRPVERARIHGGSRLLRPLDAPFAEPRRRKDGSTGFLSSACGGGAGYRSTLHARGERGFGAGVFRERALAGARARYRRFAAPGCVAVDGIVDGYEGGGIEPGPDDVVLERTLVGVAVPEGWFDDAILLPDGAVAVDRGARIHVSSEPLVAGPEAPADRWRDCPVRVWVTLAGYEDLRFERRAGDGPPVRRVMTPDDAG